MDLGASGSVEYLRYAERREALGTRAEEKAALRAEALKDEAKEDCMVEVEEEGRQEESYEWSDIKIGAGLRCVAHA